MFHREIELMENSERADRMEETAIGASAIMSGSQALTDTTDVLRRRS